jgi:hypothetical protein
MPKAKRPPIDYPTSIGGGIFRPREVVESELAAVEQVPLATPDPALAVETPPARTNERSNERRSVRHSFDVRQDQLLALAEIQAELFSKTGKKPKLGELVQEALDGYIARYQRRTNERTNGRGGRAK